MVIARHYIDFWIHVDIAWGYKLHRLLLVGIMLSFSCYLFELCFFSCLTDFSKDLQSYLLYCKNVVFAGLEPAYDDHEEERIIEDFWDFYQSHKVFYFPRD